MGYAEEPDAITKIILDDFRVYFVKSERSWIVMPPEVILWATEFPYLIR